jgi:hypothetical protein
MEPALRTSSSPAKGRALKKRVSGSATDAVGRRDVADPSRRPELTRDRNSLLPVAIRNSPLTVRDGGCSTRLLAQCSRLRLAEDR